MLYSPTEWICLGFAIESLGIALAKPWRNAKASAKLANEQSSLWKGHSAALVKFAGTARLESRPLPSLFPPPHTHGPPSTGPQVSRKISKAIKLVHPLERDINLDLSIIITITRPVTTGLYSYRTPQLKLSVIHPSAVA